ncbi:MAG: ATPase [Paucimonas sp.]|nr:ATPase [Paucimonas sp.]
MQQSHMPNQLDMLLEKIDAYMHSQPEYALTLCEEVFEQSRALREPRAYVIAAEKYGVIMDHLGRSVEARNVLFTAQQVAQSALLFAHEAIVLEEIARGYYTAGQYRLAIQYWARCIEVSDQAGRDARTWILAKVGLSQVYFGLNDYLSGLALLEEAASRIHEVEDPHLDAKIKINLGVDLAELKRFPEAYSAFMQARELCVKHEFYDYSAEAAFRLAQLELAEGKLDEAMAHLEAAVVDARRVNYRWCEAQILATQGEIHFLRGDAAAALESVAAAQAIARGDHFRHMLAKQHFAASRYAEGSGDLALSLSEFRAGHECEQQIIAESASTRNSELEEKAGLRPSVTRLLVDLSNNRLIDEGQLDPAFRLITQESSRILEVPRASVWMIDPQTSTLICRCMYLADEGRYSNSTSLRRQDYPAYFGRISEHRPLIAHDALHHPHTWELEQTYLRPNNISSLLAFPIRVGSQNAGLMCFEAVGEQRNWTPDDLAHANQLAEVASRVLSGYERKHLQQEINALNSQLLQANDTLKARVIERTAALERHNAELHALNDKLYEMKRQMLQAKQVASVGQLALSGLSEVEHGLARMEAALEPAGANSDSAALLAQLREDVARMHNLTSDLGGLAAQDESALAMLDVHQALNRVVNLVGRHLGTRIRIMREFGDVPPIQCRPVQIMNVLMHLLLNAGEALEAKEGEIKIATSSTNTELLITISDNGQGIAPDHVRRIFDAFFTTRVQGKVRGLGLPLCHSIVHAHHGRIEVSSKEGEGSVFTVRLPLKQQSAA